MARFDRVYRLLIGQSGQQGIEINPPFRITFEVEKNASEQPNPHKISVYNLTAATRRAIERPDLRCLLYAGYAEESGPLLMAAGTVTFAHTYYDGPDVVTALEVMDGYAEIRDSAVSLGYGPGVRASDIVRDLSTQMGLPLTMPDNASDRTWEHGFSFYGPARSAMHKATAGAGLEWSIQNQTMQVIDRRGTTRRQAVVLAADSGLLGYPERQREGATEKARVRDQTSGKDRDIVSAQQQRDGWKVTSLLLPTINPGDLVKLESRSIEGFFRAESVKHAGDSEGGDWKTELQLVERYAPPKKAKQ